MAMVSVSAIGDLEDLRRLLGPGAEVRPVGRGAEAGLLLLHFPADQGEGMAACREAMLRTPASPWVLLTSAGDELSVCIALSMGAVDVVRLPVSGRELRLRLAALQRRLRPRPQVGGEEALAALGLRPREAELLRILMATPGRWHSRSHLSALLWDEAVSPSALGSLLARLRPRLEGVFELETSRGLGLRLGACGTSSARHHSDTDRE